MCKTPHRARKGLETKRIMIDLERKKQQKVQKKVPFKRTKAWSGRTRQGRSGRSSDTLPIP
jgi:hypothetical protein